MLQDLKILNGELSLKFDPLNTKYTVSVASDVTELEFEYVISEEDTLYIIGNDLKDDYNEVIFTVSNEEEEMSYYLYVYKEESLEVSTDINYFSSIEAPVEEEVPELALPLIASSCFLLILFVFTFLFRKRKKA